MADGVEPRLAVQTHLDGDPKPRPDEVERFDLVRQKRNLDEILVLILTNDGDAVTGSKHFPGHMEHWWRITDAGLEPTEVNMAVLEEMGIISNMGVAKNARRS